MCQLMISKRFALRMLQDFVWFLLKLRNAGAYIPQGTPCMLRISSNLIINLDQDFISRTHAS